MVAKRRWRENQQPNGLEPALAAHHVAPVLEVLQAFESQACLRLIGVVRPYEGTTLPGGARSHMTLFDHHHALDACRGQVEGGAEAVDARADHDNIC